MTRSNLARVACMALAAGTGCEAPVRIQPGLSAVRIRVRAEPKAGYRPPTAGTLDEYGVSSGESDVDPFQRVDYAALKDIVVWAEPTTALAAAPPTVVISTESKRGRGQSPPVYATGVGSRLIVRNESAQTKEVYSVSDNNAFYLDALLPGREAEHVLRAPGVVEVLADERDDPIAIVYVAPTPWVQCVRSGKTATFTDLPPGTYHIGCWHARLPSSRQTVTLQPDEVTRARMTVGVNALSMEH